jgi:hypothetical protein
MSTAPTIPSVYRAFFCWLKGVGYKLAKHTMEHLREPEIHSNAGVDLNNRGVLSVDLNRGEGYVNRAIQDPVLREMIDKHRAGIGVANLPLRVPDAQNLTGFNNHVVAHNHPLLDEMNARSAGAVKESSEASA